MKRTNPRNPHAMLKKPTTNAVTAPIGDNDFLLIPRFEMKVAATNPRIMHLGLKGIMMPELIVVAVCVGK